MSTTKAASLQEGGFWLIVLHTTRNTQEPQLPAGAAAPSCICLSATWLQSTCTKTLPVLRMWLVVLLPHRQDAAAVSCRQCNAAVTRHTENPQQVAALLLCRKAEP
jgi:hypothetical protein